MCTVPKKKMIMNAKKLNAVNSAELSNICYCFLRIYIAEASKLFHITFFQLNIAVKKFTSKYN